MFKIDMRLTKGEADELRSLLRYLEMTEGLHPAVKAQCNLVRLLVINIKPDGDV